MTDIPLAAAHCTHEYIFHSGFDDAYQCKTIANDVCLEDVQIINFYNLFFCIFNEHMWLFLAATFVFIALIFRYISVVVEEYISEGIQVIAER